MRRIKTGDNVQAFLDVNIKGKVLAVEYEKSTTHMVGGTTGSIPICVIKLENGDTVRYKASELFHLD